MFALLPKRPIPADAVGCCAIRVIDPETPAERDLAEQNRVAAALGFLTKPIWRVTLWRDGQAFLTSLTLVNVPTVDLMLRYQREWPSQWVEIVAADAPPSAAP